MKNIRFMKITLLFLLILSIFSTLIIVIRTKYINYRQLELKQRVIETIEEKDDKKENAYNFKDGMIGLIIIPRLEIEAPIYEGTTQKVLKYTVGHFEKTSLWNGNVVLASHNEGSYAHYFSRINELKNGEEIIYVTDMGERRYSVYENKIIKETNVDVLKETKENIITLITCVKGKRNQRQCIIGIEKHERNG